MEFIINPYIVYVKLNSNGYITDINSSAFLDDITGWVEIDSGYGDSFHHAQGNYLPKSICTIGGACRYKLLNGVPAECTTEEITAQEEAKKVVDDTPTQLDRIESQVAYLAMMTGYIDILEV